MIVRAGWPLPISGDKRDGETVRRAGHAGTKIVQAIVAFVAPSTVWGESGTAVPAYERRSQAAETVHLAPGGCRTGDVL